MVEPILSIRDLAVQFDTPSGVVRAVDHISYDLYPGETLGVVGESGSGKSVSALAILGLVPRPPARITSGEVLFDGRDLMRIPPRDLRRIRGREIAMVCQDPMSSLTPVFTVGWQIKEALLVHNRSMEEGSARKRAIELLEMAQIPQPEVRYEQYPHELSGGMRQRAMIAMAVANRPKILVADEPTTALDVTVQAQVLEALRTAQRETQAATILITHDLGLIAEMADRVVVVYAGRVAEIADVDATFHRPGHPYTVALLGSLPRLHTDTEQLVAIPGQPPSLIQIPSGCAFHPRCPLMRGRTRCREEIPPLNELDRDHRAACHFHDEVPGLLEAVSRELGTDGGRA